MISATRAGHRLIDDLEHLHLARVYRLPDSSTTRIDLLKEENGGKETNISARTHARITIIIDEQNTSFLQCLGH